MPRFRTIALGVLALLPGILLLYVTGGAFFDLFKRRGPINGEYVLVTDITQFYIGAAAVLMTAAGVASTAWLAWRGERYFQRMQQLEIQLEEVRRQAP